LSGIVAMRDQLFQESADQFDAAVKEALIN
jgi:hypothetical protein